MKKEEKLTEEQEKNDLHNDEHDFDGITELNNPAPYWILWVFLITIGFSMFYVVRYFGYPNNGKDQASEYRQRSEAFDQERKEQQAATGVVLTDPQEIIAAGGKLYLQKGCIACHGMNGEGNKIGPNLTDNFWLNGCKEADLIHMITEGKPEKGMTPFKTMMSPEEIKQVTAFILKKLVGSNPANAKAPQGVECKP